jgi:subtilisin family serine protease
MALSDAQSDARHAADIAERVGYLPQSILCVPVECEDRLLGVLELLDKGEGPFGAEDLALLELIAELAATAIMEASIRAAAIASDAAEPPHLTAERDEGAPGLPLAQITPEWAWGRSTGRGVKVAVIDSGIDPGHPAVGELAGWVSVHEGPDGPIYKTEPHVDDYGHGTACGGIIRRIAPDCELYSVKVLGPSLGGRGVVFAAGLRWAVENGMDLCNLSLGTTKAAHFATLHELTDLAYFRNVIIVAAANNAPVPSFPSIYPSVISVCARPGDDPEQFSYTPRRQIEFEAPGIDVRIPWLSGGWIHGTGNSYASPHMTGIVARILAKHPGLTVFQMKTILQALAANVPGVPGIAHAET